MTEPESKEPVKEQNTRVSDEHSAGDPVSSYRDETPLWFDGWKRGDPIAEMLVQQGVISEDDLVD